MPKRLFLLILLLISCIRGMYAQSFFIPEVPHPRNKTIRNAIDEEKPSLYNISDKSLALAREFKRRDSTYYVPWMIEGIYYKEHAADKLGFDNAAKILAKAYELIIKDYDKSLKKRTKDFFEYYPLYNLHLDFSYIANNLVDCYSYTDRADSAFNIAITYGKYNLQYEGAFHNYDTKAWLVHRNRFYTSEKYYFLKNTIAENVALAHQYLDSSMTKIKKDVPTNAEFLQPGYEKYLRYSVYHYKAILHGYNLEIDSALKYYDLMKQSDYFSNNNYGNLQVVRGNFKQGFEYYQLAKNEMNAEKQLQEWVYYSSILSLYKNDIKFSIESLQEMVKKVGSTPGFGWYNIGIARAMNYSGNIDEAIRYQKKAENFKEVHIGTTLGEPHYNIALAMTKYHQLSNKLSWQKFSDKSWWYKPIKWWSIARIWLQKVMQRYKIIALLKDNPEREQVIYKLFATESTVTWDEVLMSLDGMSNNYFLKFYKKLEEEDSRGLLKVYFQYAQALMLYNKGDYTSCIAITNSLKSLLADSEYDKLLLARVLILESKCIQKERNSNDASFTENLFDIYQIYPQLLPYSGLKTKVYIHADATISSELFMELSRYNMTLVDNPSDALLIVKIAVDEDVLNVTTNLSGVDNVHTTSIIIGKQSNAALAKAIIQSVFNIYMSD